MSVPTCPYARVECVLPSSLSDSPATCKSSYTKLAVSSLKNTRNVTYENECFLFWFLSLFFWWAKTNASMRLRRFPAQESPKKRSRKILRKTTKIEYLRQPFLTFFPLLHRWRRQSPKLLLGVWKEVIFKKQKIIQTTSESCFMIVLAIDVDYFICKGCKRPVEEHKCIESHTFIMSLLSPVTVDHLKYSLNCERFVELQLYC